MLSLTLESKVGVISIGIDQSNNKNENQSIAIRSTKKSRWKRRIAHPITNLSLNSRQGFVDRFSGLSIHHRSINLIASIDQSLSIDSRFHFSIHTHRSKRYPPIRAIGQRYLEHRKNVAVKSLCCSVFFPFSEHKNPAIMQRPIHPRAEFKGKRHSTPKGIPGVSERERGLRGEEGGGAGRRPVVPLHSSEDAKLWNRLPREVSETISLSINSGNLIRTYFFPSLGRTAPLRRPPRALARKGRLTLRRPLRPAPLPPTTACLISCTLFQLRIQPGTKIKRLGVAGAAAENAQR